MIRRSTHHSSGSWIWASSRGRGQQQPRGVGDLVAAAQKLHLREDVAGVVARVRRHRIELLLAVAGLLLIAGLAVERDARLRDRDGGAPQPARRPQRGLVVVGEKPLLHARLVVGAAQELGMAFEHLLLDIGGQRIVAPDLAHQRARAFLVALRKERARQHQAAHARLRRRALKKLSVCAGLTFSTQSIASARRRNNARFGQLGLSAMKAR